MSSKKGKGRRRRRTPASKIEARIVAARSVLGRTQPPPPWYRRWYWKAVVTLLSVRWGLRTNVNGVVKYEGQHWRISRIGKQHLHLRDLTGTRQVVAAQDACESVLCWENISNGFLWGRRFYMDYWYPIWVHIGIQPWMHKLNIWGAEE